MNTINKILIPIFSYSNAKNEFVCTFPSTLVLLSSTLKYVHLRIDISIYDAEVKNSIVIALQNMLGHQSKYLSYKA